MLAEKTHPIRFGREEHQQDQGGHGKHREGDPRQTIDKKRAAEGNEIDELRRQGDGKQALARHRLEVATDEQQRDDRRDGKTLPQRQQVHQIGKQQMEGEEACGNEEHMHRMQRDAIHTPDEQNHGYEEQQ